MNNPNPKPNLKTNLTLTLMLRRKKMPKMIVVGSWKQVLTDKKACEPRFHAKVAIYEKGL